MWSIRILSGDSKGKVFPLKAGTNTIGRAPNCDIIIADQGISKQHAQIEVLADKFIISDSQSRNGTFINGVQIRRSSLKPGDRVSIYDTVFEIVPSARFHRPSAPAQSAGIPNMPQQQDVFAQAAYAYQGNAALNLNGGVNTQASAVGQASSQASAPEEKNLKSFVVRYIDEVVLPGTYRLAEVFEFKHLIALFCGIFVVIVTSLSTIPLTQILKYRIEKTSQQRALGIARTLAVSNRSSIASGLATGISIASTNREPGVDKAFIINAEGRIMAPQSLSQQYPEIPFIHAARRLGKEVVEQLDDSTIGALVPIEIQNPETGVTAPMAFAVVMYDMGTLAVDDGQTFSLFVQTLFIALIIGGIIFFFLYKLIEYPIATLEQQVSKAMSSGQGQLSVNYRFERLQSLINNFNTLLARGLSGNAFESPGQYEHERSSEAAGLVQLIGFPAIAVDAQQLRVTSLNSQFQEQIAKGANWDNISLNEVLDQALKLNLKDIVDRTFSNPNHIASNEIDIDGFPFEVSGQAVYGSKEVNYIVISFVPRSE